MIRALTLALLVSGCGESAVAPAPPPDLQDTWPVRLALRGYGDEGVDRALVGRWLAGSSWTPPGEPPQPEASSAALHSRWLREDAAALTELQLLLQGAWCDLGSIEAGFGGRLPEGNAVAALACTSAGRDVEALRARDFSAGAVLPTWTGQGTVPELLLPGLRRTLHLQGESLDYAWVLPAQWAAAQQALRAESSPAELDSVATLAWGSAALAMEPPPSGLDAAQTQRQMLLSRWRAALASAELGEDSRLVRSLIESWVDRTTARQLGLSALAAGDHEAASVLLSSLDDGSSLPDPWATMALARARVEVGETTGALRLLRRAGEQPGWEIAGLAAHWLARASVPVQGQALEVRR